MNETKCCYFLHITRNDKYTVHRIRKMVENKIKKLDIEHYDISYQKFTQIKSKASFGLCVVIHHTEPSKFKEIVEYCESKWKSTTYWGMQAIMEKGDIGKKGENRIKLEQINKILRRKWSKREMMLLDDPYQKTVEMIEKVI